MGRTAASAFSGRVPWTAALVVVVGMLAVMDAATTAAAAAAQSGGCCCPCGRGAGIKGAADFVEMDDAERTKPGPMGATVDEGDHVQAMTKSLFIGDAMVRVINNRRMNTGNYVLATAGKLQDAAEGHTRKMEAAGKVSDMIITQRDLIDWRAKHATAVSFRLRTEGPPDVIADNLVQEMESTTAGGLAIYSRDYNAIGCMVHQNWTGNNYVTCVFGHFRGGP